MLNQATREMAGQLLGTSASDCECTMLLVAENRPMAALEQVAAVLHLMNVSGQEKKAHRLALVKAGRVALKKLGEI